VTRNVVFKSNIVRAVVCALLLAVALPARPLDTAEFQTRLLPKEVEALRAEREAVRGAPNSVLVVPAEGAVSPSKDPRTGSTFDSACYVYVDENGLLVRRFAVHVPHRDLLPVARRAGRFLSHLWGAASRRFGTRAYGLRKGAVDVWLTTAGEAGGEQFGNHIYVYDMLAERTGLEWARELAHEYGHYLLPGASGYTQPENWSNGLFGERLFLKWLDEDLRAGMLEATVVPYLKAADLQEYRSKQVDPLLDYMRAHPPSAALLAGKGTQAMNLFSGLLLHVDQTYGSAVLYDMLDYLPPNASAKASGADFLKAIELWVKNAARFTTQMPAGSSTMLYLTAGLYRIEASSGVGGLTFGSGVTVAREGIAFRVRAKAAGWTPVTVTAPGAAVTLRWERLS
jgi:hypothetical protein